MTKPAIIVENLSKKYQIGLKEKANRNFPEVIMDSLAAPFRRLRNLRGGAANGEDTFWALKDVSFEVAPGEVVGIIGRNGAGKSTLLKILSRITEPTTGRAVINGRVGSLLEVGTGFHPELTGRENIYLNGAILGMKRAEITRKFDEIVAFSEIEKFLDTPVKRYSSGMYVRLAFAVAAHLEPEILIVDEVLAVGDLEFQRKCMGKMHNVASTGRTVLFVSHNMEAVRRICDSAMLLVSGQMANRGAIGTVLGKYLEHAPTQTEVRKLSHCPFEEIRFSINGHPVVGQYVWQADKPLRLAVKVLCQHPCRAPRMDFWLNRFDETQIFCFQTDRACSPDSAEMSQVWVVEYTIPSLPLHCNRVMCDFGVRASLGGSCDLYWPRALELNLESISRPGLMPDSILSPAISFGVRPVHNEADW